MSAVARGAIDASEVRQIWGGLMKWSREELRGVVKTGRELKHALRKPLFNSQGPNARAAGSLISK